MPPDRVHSFLTLVEVADFLKRGLQSEDLVLLKGRTSDTWLGSFLLNLELSAVGVTTAKKQCSATHAGSWVFDPMSRTPIDIQPCPYSANRANIPIE